MLIANFVNWVDQTDWTQHSLATNKLLRIENSEQVASRSTDIYEKLGQCQQGHVGQGHERERRKLAPDAQVLARNFVTDKERGGWGTPKCYLRPNRIIRNRTQSCVEIVRITARRNLLTQPSRTTVVVGRSMCTSQSNPAVYSQNQ